MTVEERTRIQEEARRYVRQRAPTPPAAVVERVARIVLQARAADQTVDALDQVTTSLRQSEVA